MSWHRACHGVHSVKWQICLLDWGGFERVGNNYKIMIWIVDESPSSIMIPKKPNGLQKFG
jgi:hypothetical protein